MLFNFFIGKVAIFLLLLLGLNLTPPPNYTFLSFASFSSLSLGLSTNLLRDISGNGSQAETVVLVADFTVGGVAD